MEEGAVSRCSECHLPPTSYRLSPPLSPERLLDHAPVEVEEGAVPVAVHEERQAEHLLDASCVRDRSSVRF